MNGEAEVKYLDGDFRVVRPGAFVRCAVTGLPIPLEELKYWSVDLQEAYATREAVLSRLRRSNGVKKTANYRLSLNVTSRRSSSASSTNIVTANLWAREASTSSSGSPAIRA